MGAPIAQVQSPQTSGGKGSPVSRSVDTADQMAPAVMPVPDGTTGQPQGKGASGQRFTYSPTSGQPQMGQPNPYSNTVGQWDNASIQPAQRSGGKGKGY